MAFEGTTPISMEALFDMRASQAMVSEANAFKTVPKGLYRLRPTKYEASENPKIRIPLTEVGTGAQVGDRARVVIWFSVDILDKEGNRKAKGSIKVSPDEVRTAKGYLDTQSKVYGQLVKALGLTPQQDGQEQPNAGEVVQTFMTTPVDGFVALSFKGPKDPTTGYPVWMDPQNEAEEAQYRAAGYSPTNVIRSVQKAQ